MATTITANTYADDSAAAWRLGRLTRTSVTHRRPNRTDVVRTSDFDYAMGGAATGLMTLERAQPASGASQELTTAYTLDAFGNRTTSTVCNAEIAVCGPNGLAFHPASKTAVQRTARTAFDARGRFPLATYELFWNGTGAVERATQTVVSRNLFGDATQTYNINGVDALVVPGTLGRPYYAWTETVPGSVPGAVSGGVESFITYRWCGTGGVSCPENGKFRQRTMTDGAATTWTYFDVLGRPILKTTESLNVGVAGKDISATCTQYDAAGRANRVSTPVFIAGTSATMDTVGLTTFCAISARQWTTTSYDVLGRPTDVISPDGSIVSTDYIGTQLRITDQRGNATVQSRDARGDLSVVTDANGMQTVYGYYADGSVYYISRDAGRGAVVNSFVYDATGRKIQQNDPDSGATFFEYNALGELLAQEDADGNRVENEIDARGRIWRRTVKRADGSIESQSTTDFDTAANGVGQIAAESITGLYTDWANLANMGLGFQRSQSYDTLGRPSGATTVIDGASFAGVVQYDALGRAWKVQDASGRWAKTEFNARGMSVATCNSSAADIVATCPADANTYVRSLEGDAWGHVTKERRGNSAAMDVSRTYNAQSGRLFTLCAGNASCSLVNEGYAWDAAGNLNSHTKDGRYFEEFAYDSLNRLSSGTLLYEDGIAVNKVVQSFQYDALGNICYAYKLGKSRSYSYRGKAGCGLGGPLNSAFGSAAADTIGAHQVTGTGAPPSNPPVSLPATLYAYDARGNQTDQTYPDVGGDRYIHYSVDNKAYEIGTNSRTAATFGTRFWYGPDGNRYKRVDIATGETRLYIGNVEIIVQPGQSTFRRTVAGVMLQTSTSPTSSATNNYLFHDQLGSVVRITDFAGVAIERLDYAAFGENRDFNDPSVKNYNTPALTNRGFTGQEAALGGVIHFNGRLFDPFLGRFLQVDPVVQAPLNPQSWNGYAYVFNNPLRYTDPTGLIGQDERQALGAIVVIVASIFAPYVAPYLKFAYAVAVGAVAGGITTGTWQGAMYGAFSAAIFYGIGSYFRDAQWAQATEGSSAFDTGLNWGGYGAKVVAHGVAGGVMSRLQGGRFGNGFAAAGVSEAFAPAIDTIGDGADSYAPVRIAASAVLGGTASVISGGKFANGAITASFSYTFNDTFHGATEDARTGVAVHAAVYFQYRSELENVRINLVGDMWWPKSGLVDLEWMGHIFEIKPETYSTGYRYGRAKAQVAGYVEAAGSGYRLGNPEVLGLGGSKVREFDIVIRNGTHESTWHITLRADTQRSGLLFYSKEFKGREVREFFRMPNQLPAPWWWIVPPRNPNSDPYAN
jgi:RHS repeat-associated protein